MLLLSLEAMMLPSAAAASGPRAKRARQPDLVQTKDTAGPMGVTEMSRFVRNLCRQHDKDRVAWLNMVGVTNDHAKMIDELEHEALQVRDNMSSLMDNMMVGVRNDEVIVRAGEFDAHTYAIIRRQAAQLRDRESGEGEERERERQSGREGKRERPYPSPSLRR